MKKCFVYLLCLCMLCCMVACGTNGHKKDGALVKIVNASSEEIYGIGYTYYVNGEVISSGGVCNADNSAIKKGDRFPLDNIPDVEEFELELSVQDKDGNEYPCATVVTVNKKSEEPYVIMISGDFKKGFKAERDL